MINPYKGVLINNKYYGYVDDSFRETLKIKNSIMETQTSRTGTFLGAAKESFTLTISLDNSYNVWAGSSFVGSTSWSGVSRLADFKVFMGAIGTSLAIPFITPYGGSYSVIPVGQLDISMFNPENPTDSSGGVEFRVTLTLEVL